MREHLGELLHRPLKFVELVDLERLQGELMAKPVLYVRGGRQVGSRARGKGGINTIFRLLHNLWTWAEAREYNVGVMPDLADLEAQEAVEVIVWPELVPRFLYAVDHIPPMYNKKPETVSTKRQRSEDQLLAVRLQLLAGLREGEALGFHWRGMDWRRGIYSPEKTKNRKTREIPLAEDLLDRLRARWEAQGRPADGLAIPDDETGEPHRKGYTSRTVRLAGLAVDLVGLHNHRLRATFATTLWEIGTPLVQISLMMGHTRPETTLGYIVPRRKDQAESIARMSEAMGFASSATRVPPENEASA